MGFCVTFVAKAVKPDLKDDTGDNTPKGKFTTKTFGVKRPTSPEQKKRTRKYSCPASHCNSNFLDVSKLNSNYKESH